MTTPTDQGNGIFGGKSLWDIVGDILAGEWQGNVEMEDTQKKNDRDEIDRQETVGRITSSLRATSDRSIERSQSVRTEMFDVDDEDVSDGDKTTKKKRRGQGLFRINTGQ